MATRKKTAKPANTNGSPDPETELRTAAGYGSNNPKLNDLAGNLEESAGELLTTNQGLRDQRQSELTESRRPRSDPAGRFHPPRKNHALRPRTNSRAGGSCPRRGGPRLLSGLSVDGRIHKGRLSPGPVSANSGVRSFLHRGGLAWVDGPGPRRARLRRQVLHAGRQLRPGRQQHSGFLHSGCDQVS